MANWFDKLSKVAEQVVTVVEDATAKTVKTYQEQGFNGIVEKTNTLLDKTGDKLEKVGAVAAEKTQGYLKNLGEANKEVMTDVENNMGKGTTTAKIAGGLAATAFTAQTIVLDLASVTKNAYQKFANAQEGQQPIGQQSVESMVEALPLEKILELIMEAKKVDNKWVTKNGTSYIVFDDSWYCPSTQAGDKNAVTLTAYHLAALTKLNYDDALERKELMKAAYDVLATSGLVEVPVSNEAKQEVEEKVEKAPAKKAPVAKKTAAKKAVKANSDNTVHAEANAIVKTDVKNEVKNESHIEPTVKASKKTAAKTGKASAQNGEIKNEVKRTSRKPAKVGAIVVENNGEVKSEVKTKAVRKSPAKKITTETQVKPATSSKKTTQVDAQEESKPAAKTVRKAKP